MGQRLKRAFAMIPPSVKTVAFRASIADLVEQRNPALAITLAFNRDTTPTAAAADLRHLHARLDRMTLGHSWAKRTSQRTASIAVIEHPTTNLHIHLALSCQPQFVARLQAEVPDIWAQMVPSGSVKVEPIFDALGWGRYISKEITPGTAELLLLS